MCSCRKKRQVNINKKFVMTLLFSPFFLSAIFILIIDLSINFEKFLFLVKMEGSIRT